MKNLYLFLISCILGATSQLKAQSVTISSPELSKYYGEEVLKISNIIHNAMLKGQITVYANDSLVRKLSREEYKKNTAQVKTALFLKEGVDRENVDLDDPINYKDSIINVPKQPIADLGVCYNLSPNLYPTIKQDIIAVGPMFDDEYQVVENGNTITKTATYMPGCVKYADLKLILNKNQMTFLNSYTWLKGLNGKKTEDYIILTHDQNISKISGNLTKILGDWIEYHLTYLSLSLMINGKIPIFTKDSAYSISTFVAKNSMIVQQPILKVGGESTNPDDYYDTLINQSPSRFDNLGLKWHQNKIYLALNYTEFSQGEQYLVELEKIKHLLMPAEYNLLDLYFKLRKE